MEISNPIASQYVTNQGLALQLNSAVNQLPVKSERPFADGAANKKIPPPTEDNARLKNERDKNSNKGRSATIQVNSEQTNSNDIGIATPPDSIKSLLQSYNQNSFQNQDDIQNTNEQTLLTKQQNNTSKPIQSYLETSNLNSPASSLARIDFFI